MFQVKQLSEIHPNLGDAVESSVRLPILSVVEEAAKDEHAHEDEREEESEVLVACLHCVHDRLQTDGSSCQFEHTHNSGNAKNLPKQSVTYFEHTFGVKTCMIFPTPAKALGSSASITAPGAGGSRSAAGEIILRLLLCNTTTCGMQHYF